MFFTGKGDDGTTQLYGDANRHPKSGIVLEALGSVDELDTFVGVCRAQFAKQNDNALPDDRILTDVLREVQETLFIIQAELAGANKTVPYEKVTSLEATISAIEKMVPKIQHFTIPGSTYESALLDRARSMTRTVERRIVSVRESGRELRPETLAYVNRLSSLFFALARFLEYSAGAEYEAPHYR
jgi:cob(I)alamin adenosyltransferase